jgi:surface antigen
VLENSQELTHLAAKKAARLGARTKKLNLALLGSHIAVVLGILGIVVVGYKAPVEASPVDSAHSVLDQPTTSIDQIAAANVASHVAQTVDMSVQNNVQNLAVSLNAKTQLAQTDNSFLTKPQIVQANVRKGVSSYTAKAGDTVQTVAAQFGVSEDTIRWANNLTSDAITAGSVMKIPGTTGVIYAVKAGDTLASIASTYQADPDLIVSYNDLELTGVQPGQTVVIPNGILPQNLRPGARATYSTTDTSAVSNLHVTIYGGNDYAYGYCTWYAYNRRAELGRPIGSNWGNANTWATYARAAGFRVDKTPEAGAVFQIGGGWGGLGHVGVVEQVNPDGSIFVSEMNYKGWNIRSTRTITASEVPSYNFIH